MGTFNRLRRLPGRYWFVATILGLVLIGALVAIWLWGWMRAGGDQTQPQGETVRSLGLIGAGTIAVVFALWRSWVAEKQADTAQRQAETALDQASTARQVMQNERFQRGAEMLGHSNLSVRLGGIYALQRLAQEDLKEYYLQVIQLFCAFVRMPPRDETMDDHVIPIGPNHILRLRGDVQAAMAVFGSRIKANLELESGARFLVDLVGADLRYADLKEMNLSYLWLWHADLSHVDFFGADLSFVNFYGSNLSLARFWETDFSHVNLINANLSGTSFASGNPNLASATGLTQDMLDLCYADPGHDPILDGMVDPKSGDDLVWKSPTPPRA